MDMQAAKTEEQMNNTQLIHKLQEQYTQMENMLIKARVDIEVKSAENMALEEQVCLRSATMALDS